MRIKTIILLAILTTGSLFAQTEDITVTGDFHGMPFSDFALYLDREYSVKVYYNPDWVTEIQVTNTFRSTSLDMVFSSILNPRGLYYYIDDSGYVVVTGKFKVKSASVTSSEAENYIYNPDAQAGQIMNAGDEMQIIEIGRQSGDNRGTVTLSGYMRNLETGEPVIGAVFMIEEMKTGTMTNQYGYYSITLPKGNYHAQVSCLGMKSIDRQVNIYANGTLDIDLKENLIALGSVTITAQGSTGMHRTQVGLEKLSIRTIKLVPTSMGEPDIIKTALLLPGVQSVGEGSVGFNVRGGSADQNLVLLYDAPLFHTSHFFGFFPAVNSDIISDISLYKGGIPAKYGGRISSVLDIIPKDGNKKEFSGSGGISPVTTHLMVEGPIIKDRTSFLASGRTTYSNWVLKLFEDTQLRNSSVNFWDTNLRLVHQVNEKNNIEASGYLSHDHFSFNSDTVYSYNNNIGSLKWRHLFNNQLFAVFSLNHSNYNYNITSASDTVYSFGLEHYVNFSELKAHVTYYPNFRHQVDFGFDLARYGILPGELSPLNDSSLVIHNIVEKQRGWSPSFFISDEIKLFDKLDLYVGLRLSSFMSTGPSTVYSYHPDYPRSLATITDTTIYSGGKVIKSYFNPELRLSLSYQPFDNLSVKLNYNNTVQYIHLLSNTTSISPSDIWVLSDKYFKPQRGEQIAAGIYTTAFNQSVEISVEAYYKNIHNMLDFKGGATLLMNQDLETEIVNTDGDAKGVEFMVRKNEGRMNGWISYTYSSIRLKSTTSFTSEMINSGNYFPANYDKPHDLSVLFNYIFSRRFSFSTTYSYSTGRPITYPIASYTVGGVDILHYSDRNKYRIPDYSRLDLSFTIEGSLRANKLAHSTLTFSVFNLLGRNNVYSIYFKTEQNIVHGYKLSIFARPIPSVSYNFKF